MKRILFSGEYEIAVIFTCPVNYARDMFDEQSKDHMVPPDCVPGIFKVIFILSCC